MIVESAPGGTVVSGQSTGPSNALLEDPRMAAVLALEREFAAGQQDEQSFRKKWREFDRRKPLRSGPRVDVDQSGQPLE